ncbi:MAG TPA: LysR family transcriptional regulator, partial [Gemmatimonadales bacterium]|nr:LysR family transcriptional regulator [Gemmatimonadales bacterium]
MAGRSGIDLRDLRYFAAVAETRNLSSAARMVRVAQPALSRRIRALERELGVALLERHARGVALTPAGESLAAGATLLLGDTAAALDGAGATAAGRRGRVVLSALRAAIVRGFPSAVQESLGRDHPEIVLVVQDFDPPATWQAVVDGRADVAVSVEDALPPGLSSQPLWGEALDCAIVPYGHPLAPRGRVTLTELAELPLVVPRQTLQPAVLDRLLDTLRAAGLRSAVLALDGDLRSSHLAVAAGRGWALLARSRAAMPPEGTASLRIAELNATVGVVALWRRGERRLAVQTVLRCMVDVARGYPESRVPAA